MAIPTAIRHLLILAPILFNSCSAEPARPLAINSNEDYFESKLWTLENMADLFLQYAEGNITADELESRFISLDKEQSRFEVMEQNYLRSNDVTHEEVLASISIKALENEDLMESLNAFRDTTEKLAALELDLEKLAMELGLDSYD